MSSDSEDRRWFGNLLDWTWRADEARHTTWHAGRPHHIAKISRRYADQLGGGTSPGWHIWTDQDLAAGIEGGWGPGVGRYVGTAKRLAEAWIICPAYDMNGYPQLAHALRPDGVGYMETGRHLIYAQDGDRRFVATSPDGTVGYLFPIFTGPGGTVEITWQVADPAGAQVDAILPTWRAAVTVVKEQLVPAGRKAAALRGR